MLNQVAIDLNQASEFKHGDVITVGDRCLRFAYP